MGAAGARIPTVGATIRGRRGRLAQLVERLLYTQVAAGSSPAPPIQTPLPMRMRVEAVGKACEEPWDLRNRAAPGAVLEFPSGRNRVSVFKPPRPR